MKMDLNKYFAEFLGTLLLVFMGVGAAVLAGEFIGFVGVSFAFGLTLMFLAYCIGPVSGCHINPAVTLGLCLAKKFPASQVIPYILMQLIGGIVGAALVYFIASGKVGFDVYAGFAANGYGLQSPGGYTAIAAGVTEVVTTALLIFTVLCTTRNNFPLYCREFAIGITLIIIHLFSIPVTNTSANFARTLATAVFVDDFSQLWLFGVSHIIAAGLAVLIYGALYCRHNEEKA